MRNDILYKELSYQVVGALFDAFKILGSSYHEKYCQKTVEKYLKKRNINFVTISDIKQVQMYLKTTKLRLGILAYFGSDGIKYKRILNSHSL